MPPATEYPSSDDADDMEAYGTITEAPGGLRRLFDQVVNTLMPSAVRLIGAGFQFLSTIMVARALGSNASAPFFFWSSVLMTSGPIASYGLEQIALRNVPRLECEGKEAVARFVGNLRALSFAIALLIGLIWSLYATWTEPSPGGFHLWHLLPLAAQGAISLTLINGEAFKGLSRPVFGTLYGHVLPAGIFFLFVLLFAPYLGSPGILTAYVASFTAGVLLAQIAPGGDFRHFFLCWPDRTVLRSLLREGFPVCCASVFGALGFIIPLAICDRLLPPSEISHLTAAFRVAILFVVLSSAIHSVFAPALSRSAESPKPLVPVMRVFWKAGLIALGTLILPLAFGILFPSETMALFGEEFRSGADILYWLLIFQLLYLLLGPMAYLLLMTGQTVFLARLGVVKLILTITLSALLIPRYSGLGMVAALGIGGLAEAVIGIGYALWKMKIKGMQSNISHEKEVGR